MTNPNPQNNNPEKEPASSRRSLLTKLWVLLGIVALAELLGIVFAFLKPSPKKSSAVDRAVIIVAGPVDNFQPGTVTAFVRGKFYLARLEDGGFLALSRSCTHLGCIPLFKPTAGQNDWGDSVPSDWAGGWHCPCHGSYYDMSARVVNGSPAPHNLHVMPYNYTSDTIVVIG